MVKTLFFFNTRFKKTLVAEASFETSAVITIATSQLEVIVHQIWKVGPLDQLASS